jgi:hypothetical protein
MSFESKPASRQSVKPLIVLYSESGCGKTYGSLLLARGFVGANGRIEFVDTERGRGQLYADVIPGGYNVTDFDEPFHPSRFVEVIKHVEKSGAQIGVLDSGSAEWEGSPGGVLDLAAENEQKSGKPGLHVWRQPKIEHAKFVQALLRSTIPWVVCLRAKHKSRQAKQDGRSVIVKDDHTSPLQSEDFIFEATVHGEIMTDHTFRLTKCSHPDLRRCMPNNELITIEHGKLLAQWCVSPGNKSTNGNGKSELLSELRAATVSIHGWAPPMKAADWSANKSKLEQWLWDEDIIADTEALGELDATRLREVIELVKAKLAQPA